MDLLGLQGQEEATRLEVQSPGARLSARSGAPHEFGQGVLHMPGRRPFAGYGREAGAWLCLPRKFGLRAHEMSGARGLCPRLSDARDVVAVPDLQAKLDWRGVGWDGTGARQERGRL